RSFASATRMSGWTFSAWASSSARLPFSGAAGLPEFGAGSSPSCGRGLVGGWPTSSPPTTSSTNRLIAGLRILFLLFTGLFQGHDQPVVAGRNLQVLLGSHVETVAVAAQGRLPVALLGRVAIARPAVQGRPPAQAVERPLLQQGRRARLGNSLGR